MRNNPSFRWRILSGFIISYCALWLLFLSFGIGIYRQSVNQLFREQEWWLQRYTQTFLNDLQVGNVITVERKLKQLVTRGIFVDAKLSFGATTLSATRSSELQSALATPSPLVQFLLPHAVISVQVRDDSNSGWGVLSSTVDRATLLAPVTNSLREFTYYSGASFFVFLAGLLFLVEWQIRPLSRLMQFVSGFTGDRSEAGTWDRPLKEELNLNTRELDQLASEFKAAIANIVRLEELGKRQKVEGEISKIALQVAHDIRSPLTALNIVMSTADSMPEKSRVLAKQAVSRIQDIAHDLLKYTRPSAQPEQAEEKRNLELVSSIIEMIVSEKRIQFKEREGVEISTHWLNAAHGLFANVQTNTLKRVLSNLINNSVEAIPDSGSVSVECAERDGFVSIAVRDSGKGIPKSILPRLMEAGISHGKPGGQGLGLYHAKQAVESWDGSIRIESSEGLGTLVELRIPVAKTPRWFVPALEIEEGSTLVILDDDESIHGVWKQRLEAVREKKRLSLVHFSLSSEIERWWNENSDHKAPMTFLIDYELLRESKTGLDVIETLGIESRSILVTSRHAEPAVQSGCARLNVRMIPKGVAPYVPIV